MRRLGISFSRAQEGRRYSAFSFGSLGAFKTLLNIFQILSFQAGFSFVKQYSDKLFEKDQVVQIRDVELNCEANWMFLLFARKCIWVERIDCLVLFCSSRWRPSLGFSFRCLQIAGCLKKSLGLQCSSSTKPTTNSLSGLRWRYWNSGLPSRHLG